MAHIRFRAVEEAQKRELQSIVENCENISDIYGVNVLIVRK
ncbi:hypothetical protein C7377_1277 [Balneicella halophila]|uniref:Uncharacterized protein n=1 Tax=Balneicella halophila TaxID=1537566 RepID=A0A7L4UPB0_BALHA|nr:hypothetical protein C7377_1277 [Balneicella halophila]